VGTKYYTRRRRRINTTSTWQTKEGMDGWMMKKTKKNNKEKTNVSLIWMWRCQHRSYRCIDSRSLNSGTDTNEAISRHHEVGGYAVNV